MKSLGANCTKFYAEMSFINYTYWLYLILYRWISYTWLGGWGLGFGRLVVSKYTLFYNFIYEFHMMLFLVTIWYWLYPIMQCFQKKIPVISQWWHSRNWQGVRISSSLWNIGMWLNWPSQYTQDITFYRYNELIRKYTKVNNTKSCPFFMWGKTTLSLLMYHDHYIYAAVVVHMIIMFK